MQMEQTEQKDTWYYEHDEAEYIGGEGEISGGGGTGGHFIGGGGEGWVILWGGGGWGWVPGEGREDFVDKGDGSVEF